MATLNKKLLKEIEDYVKANELGDTNEFINNLLRKAFINEKYGYVYPDKPAEAKVEVVEPISPPKEKPIKPIVEIKKEEKDDLYNE